MQAYKLIILEFNKTRWNICGEHSCPRGELLLYSGKPENESHELGVGVVLSRLAKLSLNEAAETRKTWLELNSIAKNRVRWRHVVKALCSGRVKGTYISEKSDRKYLQS